jgi:hypothetical protein
MNILAEISDKTLSPWVVLMFSIPLAAFGTWFGTVARRCRGGIAPAAPRNNRRPLRFAHSDA